VIGPKQALGQARLFLAQSGREADFDLSRLEVRETADGWEFWFPKSQAERPAQGAIRVNRESGQASWFPL
jgi:hypothetical protein